jgi:hypothetical protein
LSANPKWFPACASVIHFLPEGRFFAAFLLSHSLLLLSCESILVDLFLKNGTGFEMAAAIVDNEFDIAAVHIQAVTTWPGLVDQGADF